jgi:hypothetical protein
MASQKRIGALASAGIKLASYFFLRWVRDILFKSPGRVFLGTH